MCEKAHAARGDDHGHGLGLGDASPFIQHHYDDAQLQFDSGKFGMLVFLAEEVLFFSATEDARTDGDDLSLAAGKADAWRPYVDGPLTDHPVPCGHYTMTEPAPMAMIGAVIAKALRPVTG